MSDTTILDFTMDKNLLLSVIKSQAGTLSKALLEGVMNSIDASATRVDLTVTTEGFTITDNGRGFASEEEIRNLFGRFGTPHKEGDATYGRFRMGRGQLMAFAATVWRSGTFEMKVDIEKDGPSYELSRLPTPVKGCVIDGRLYKPISEWKLRDTLEELKHFVAYAPKPVYVNGELYGASPARLSSWTYEDEDAYYRLRHDAPTLDIYNLGVFVESKWSSQTGLGGVVVAKKALAVNFARNAVMEEKCQVWARISAKLERLVAEKLSRAKALSESERKYVAGRLLNLGKYPWLNWRDIKLLTDPSGKHLPLSALRNYNRLVHLNSEQTALACAVHGVDGTFVITDRMLERFGVSTLDGFLTRLRRLDDVLPDNYEIVDPESLRHMGLGRAKQLSIDGLTRKEQAAFSALKELNEKLADRLMFIDEDVRPRELRVGTHRGNSFAAWTDGKTYITVNRKYLKRFNQGVDGVFEWLVTLVHEYTHDSDDSESHDHGEVFYRKFHDTACSPLLTLPSLAREGTKEYLRQLHSRGVPRPRRLMKQLRG